MRHAKLALLATALGALVALDAACSSMDADAASGEHAPGGSTSSGGYGDGGAAMPSTDEGPTATGVLVVHAAAFPAFRLCFENALDLPPQPDSSVMPEANVVGVEIGSLVRVDPMQAPGKIYVIRESAVRSTPGETNPPTCRELVAPPEQKTDKTLTKDTEYHVADAVTQDLGEAKVSVLAITGCGGKALLNAVGLSSEACGDDWDVTSGNLKAKVVDLNAATTGSTDESLPVQLFQMSQALDAFKGTEGSLAVTFGDLTTDAGTARQEVPAGALFTGGPQTDLAIDQTDVKVYGSWGFRVVASTASGQFALEQSLADVQGLSSPRDVPTVYYRAASNYALLLLGDPTHAPALADGGVNALYNPRQAVHILAVPVIDPSKADAGTDGGAEDGGT
jgi:hypothetical protein